MSAVELGLGVALPSREQNIQAISDAWGILSSREIQGRRGLTPIVDTGSSLEYFFWPYSSSSASLGLRILTGNRDELALRSFLFQQSLSSDTIVGVTSESRTIEDHESNGFGTGLILISNEVLIDVKKRYPERFQGKTLLARIFDTAIGQGEDENGAPRNRRNWSSYFAQRLGYEHNPKNGYWTKKY